MSHRSREQEPSALVEQWAKNHAGCPCTRFSDFDVSRGQQLLSSMEGILCVGLWPPRSLPPVSLIKDADTKCSSACQAKPGVTGIHLARGSCVNWTTVLVAYVHAISHVLNDGEDERERKRGRHGIEWQRCVDTVTELLTTPGKGLDHKHFPCIKDSIRCLRRAPHDAEYFMSIPVFLSEYCIVTDRKYPSLSWAMEDAVDQRRNDANEGAIRWRFQDDFEAVDAAMQLNGHVALGSVMEFALKLKRDHEPRCKCCNHEVYTPREAKKLVERLVGEILPVYLTVFFYDVPTVKCLLSSRPSKASVYDEKFLYVNLNRLETFADAMRVVVREWARRFVKTEHNVTENFQTNEKYLRAVAGFSSLLIAAHPFDGLLSNWFASESCLHLALIPAYVWPTSMVPLMRINKQGAEKVLQTRTFQDTTPDDVDEGRERGIILRESAMHAGLEGTCDFKDYEDFLAIRGPAMQRSFRRPTDKVAYEFRVRSVKLDVVETMLVRGDVTVIDMTDRVVMLVSESIGVPDDPSLYVVRFNDELIDDSECAAKVAEEGMQIRIEPIMRQVRVFKGWTREIALDIGAPSTITARDLLELMEIKNPDSACILQSDCLVLSAVDTVDTKARLRVFKEGYVHLLACVNIGTEEIRDSIVVEACRLDDPLEDHLARWRWTYGIEGYVECEESLVLSSTTVRDMVHTERAERCRPLRVKPVQEPTEQDVPVHKILVQTSGGGKSQVIKVKPHHTLESGFSFSCKTMGILPQSAQLMTVDGHPVEPGHRLYRLRLNRDITKLILTRKVVPQQQKRKRLRPLPRNKGGSPEKRRFGKFGHPRPSTSYVVISSDSEDDDTDRSRTRNKDGSPEKRRLGKFAHPRPSTSYIVISSDSENDDTDGKNK